MTKWYQPVLLVALVGTGIGLIVAGSNLMCQHQLFEMAFQYKLLGKLGSDYHWRSIGDNYLGLGEVIAGAFLMAVAAIAALVSRALERPNAVGKNDVEPAAGAGRGHRQHDPDGNGGKHAGCEHTGIWEL